MLQECLEGGEFEYVPAIRTAEDENFAGVGAVLKGDRELVRCLRAAPGALTLFRGRVFLASRHSRPRRDEAGQRGSRLRQHSRPPAHSPQSQALFYGADEDEPR
jgi:hypothetical protein